MSKNNFIYRIIATDYTGEQEDNIIGHYLSNGLAKSDLRKLLPKFDEWNEVRIEKIILGRWRPPSIIYRLVRDSNNDWKEIK